LDEEVERRHYCSLGNPEELKKQLKRLNAAYDILNLGVEEQLVSGKTRHSAISYDIRFVSPPTPEDGMPLFGVNAPARKGVKVYPVQNTLVDFIRMSSEEVNITDVNGFFEDAHERKVEDRIGTVYWHGLYGVDQKDSHLFNEYVRTMISMCTGVCIYNHTGV